MDSTPVTIQSSKIKSKPAYIYAKKSNAQLILRGESHILGMTPFYISRIRQFKNLNVDINYTLYARQFLKLVQQSKAAKKLKLKLLFNDLLFKNQQDVHQMTHTMKRLRGSKLQNLNLTLREFDFTIHPLNQVRTQEFFWIKSLTRLRIELQLSLATPLNTFLDGLTRLTRLKALDFKYLSSEWGVVCNSMVFCKLPVLEELKLELWLDPQTDHQFLYKDIAACTNLTKFNFFPFRINQTAQILNFVIDALQSKQKQLTLLALRIENTDLINSSQLQNFFEQLLDFENLDDLTLCFKNVPNGNSTPLLYLAKHLKTFTKLRELNILYATHKNEFYFDIEEIGVQIATISPQLRNVSLYLNERFEVQSISTLFKENWEAAVEGRFTMNEKKIDTGYEAFPETINILKNLTNPHFEVPNEVTLTLSSKNPIPCFLCLANLKLLLSLLSKVENLGIAIDKTDEYCSTLMAEIMTQVKGPQGLYLSVAPVETITGHFMAIVANAIPQLQSFKRLKLRIPGSSTDAEYMLKGTQYLQNLEELILMIPNFSSKTLKINVLISKILPKLRKNLKTFGIVYDGQPIESLTLLKAIQKSMPELEHLKFGVGEIHDLDWSHMTVVQDMKGLKNLDIIFCRLKSDDLKAREFLLEVIRMIRRKRTIAKVKVICQQCDHNLEEAAELEEEVKEIIEDRGVNNNMQSMDKVQQQVSNDDAAEDIDSQQQKVQNQEIIFKATRVPKIQKLQLKTKKKAKKKWHF